MVNSVDVAVTARCAVVILLTIAFARCATAIVLDVTAQFRSCPGFTGVARPRRDERGAAQIAAGDGCRRKTGQEIPFASVPGTLTMVYAVRVEGRRREVVFTVNLARCSAAQGRRSASWTRHLRSFGAAHASAPPPPDPGRADDMPRRRRMASGSSRSGCSPRQPPPSCGGGPMLLVRSSIPRRLYGGDLDFLPHGVFPPAPCDVAISFALSCPTAEFHLTRHERPAAEWPSGPARSRSHTHSSSSVDRDCPISVSALAASGWTCFGTVAAQASRRPYPDPRGERAAARSVPIYVRLRGGCRRRPAYRARRSGLPAGRSSARSRTASSPCTLWHGRPSGSAHQEVRRVAVRSPRRRKGGRSPEAEVAGTPRRRAGVLRLRGRPISASARSGADLGR